MVSALIAALALALTSAVVNFSTPRAEPRMSGLGWLLSCALFGVAVAALRQHLAIAVAVAVALCGLMLGIPVVSAALAVRNRKRDHSGS